MAEIKRAAEAEELYKKAKESNSEKAAALYSEVLALLPNDDDSFTYHYTNTSETVAKDDVYVRRYETYVNLDQLEKALDDISKAISIYGKSGNYYAKRSEVYLKLGETEKAKTDVEKAVEVTPNNAGSYYYNFGANLEKQTGNKREAAVYLKKAIEHGDDYTRKFAKEKLAEWGM